MACWLRAALTTVGVIAGTVLVVEWLVVSILLTESERGWARVIGIIGICIWAGAWVGVMSLGVYLEMSK